MKQSQINKRWDSLFKSSEKKKKIKDPVKKAYYDLVWAITEAQPLYKLDNINLRGKTHHLDHIYPISKGFKNNISENLIGHISNLQILSKRDNFLKATKCEKTEKSLCLDQCQ